MNVLDSNVKSVREILDNSHEWLGIDDLVKKMEAERLFPPELAASAVSKAQKTHIRRALSMLKDKDGFPLYPSVLLTDADGKKRRVYKQETLFDVDDYKEVINTHVRLSNHHRQMAMGYVERCEARHQVQLTLWDLDNEGGTIENEIDADWITPPIDIMKAK